MSVTFYLGDDMTQEEVRESVPERRMEYFPWGNPSLENVAFCEKHGYVKIDRENSWAGPGFAGGMIFHTEYRCGCSDHDESADLLAAMLCSQRTGNSAVSGTTSPITRAGSTSSSMGGCSGPSGYGSGWTQTTAIASGSAGTTGTTG